MVSKLWKIFVMALFEAKGKLQHILAGISSRIGSVAHLACIPEDSDQSGRTLCFLSLLLLISLVLMSPDRIIEAFSSQRPETGMLEKAQELVKLVRRLIPSLA